MAPVLLGRQSFARCFVQARQRVQAGCQILKADVSYTFGYARFASQSSRPPKLPKASTLGKPSVRRGAELYVRKRQVDPSKKAASLLNHLSKAKKQISAEAKVISPKVEQPTLVAEALIVPKKDALRTVEVDENEAAIQCQIVKNRTKLFWPGIWTVFAVTGTYGVLAFLDAKFGPQSSDETAPSKRVEISQSWFLTPTVIRKGVEAGWAELDKLTIGIVVASVGIHFLKKSPLPIWEKLIHITGEKKYTAFTYPFVHSNWAHLGQNMFALCWFLPGVVHYLDEDLFHAAAFFTTVPLITTYLQHYAFRWTPVAGIPLNMGSSGAIAAVLGAFCMAYPDEKVWTPNFLIFRLDAKFCGALFAVWQLVSVAKATSGGGNRPAFIVSYSRLLFENETDKCRSTL
jgi:membrane associated rhomboid family serine protease